MEARVFKESDYAIIIKTEEDYILFQKNSWDNDMGTFGMILKNIEPFPISLHRNQLYIYFPNGNSLEKEVLQVTNNEVTINEFLTTIKSYK
ncbi:hypothetical protein [Acinetobacter radioresistens]|jgi:hypothetical protein|uniref:hypothetical protein n=1 Tax=Acinetobacter radioresistens TaxID=40216 RepID=UPI0011A8BD8C|nr:hypothetical protein [Acinetobacter radioresistens]MCK4113694.1 hypothetical protein [Acinetobacter radioresistens]